MYLIDKSGTQICEVRDSQIDSNSVTGKVRKATMPARLEELLAIYEERVNSLVFSLLDDLEEEINGFEIQVVLDDQKFKIKNLQLMNHEDISFDIEGFSREPLHLP